MQVCQILRIIQTDALTIHIGVFLISSQPFKAIKQLFLFFGQNTLSRIGHAYLYVFPVAFHSNVDTPPFRCVLNGVTEQVIKYLFHLLRIKTSHRILLLFSVHVYRQPFFVGNKPEVRYLCLNESYRVYHGNPELLLVLLTFLGVKQLLHKPQQAVGIAQHDIHQATLMFIQIVFFRQFFQRGIYHG